MTKHRKRIMFTDRKGKVMFSQVFCSQSASWLLVHCSSLLWRGRYASSWNAFLFISIFWESFDYELSLLWTGKTHIENKFVKKDQLCQKRENSSFRVFHKPSTIQECQYCQLCLGYAIQNNKTSDVYNLEM